MFQAWGAKIQSAKITESRPAFQIPNKYILGAELAPIRLDIVAQLQGELNKTPGCRMRRLLQNIVESIHIPQDKVEFNDT